MNIQDPTDASAVTKQIILNVLSGYCPHCTEPLIPCETRSGPGGACPSSEKHGKWWISEDQKEYRNEQIWTVQ